MNNRRTDPILEHRLQINRRCFFGRAATGIGAAALASLLCEDAFAETRPRPAGKTHPTHFRPKAKRVIYLFQSGGPSQLDLYDYKPELKKRFGQDVPRSIYPDDRKTTMTNAQTSFPTAPSIFPFKQCGECGTWMSSLLPGVGGMADDICLIRSAYTEAINHDPAITFFQTGSQIPGRPSIGAWLSYGLGCESADLPAFVAMSSRGSGKAGQPLYDRLWGSGFLPSRFQGVKFRNQGAPVLDIYDPKGVDRETRKTMLKHLAELNRLKFEQTGDPEIQTRIAQYELAYRMQTSVPELLNFNSEPKHVLEMYGRDVRKQGTYAYNCLIARRLAERGVRFIQLFHQGWDQHGALPRQIRGQCRDTDQPTAALLRDLKRRGLLDDTLVVWGGEFGRTVYSQGKLTKTNYGRDHHPSCMSVWMAGGGVKGGVTHGETDDYSVNVATDGVHVHDLQATILHLMGIDHTLLTYKYQGRAFRLTDVHGKVVREVIA
ncbi:MAG: DUF1501 domain-containing protein [Planctomycetaceae bacterium]